MFRKTLAALILTVGVVSALPAAAQEAPAPDRLVETYRDWTLRCGVPANAPAGSPRSCEVAQELSRQAPGQQPQRILSIFVVRGEGGTGQITFLTPLGLSLPAGIVLSVGEETLAELAYATCRPAGCISGTRLEGPLLAAFEAGGTARLRVRTLEGQDVAVEFSLQGFAVAWARLGQI
jgi:invasion protein IalB